MAFVFAAFRGPLKKWLAMGVALACLIPWFAWETFSPRPIDLTAYSDTVDYEFRDEEYADEYGACRQYLPEEAFVDRAWRSALAAGRPPAELAELLRQRVILDLPLRYY